MDWKIVAASARGQAHIAMGIPCEDSFHWKESEDLLVAVVSDGAGSAADSEFGAYHAAKTICEEVLLQFTVHHDHPDREELEFWIKTAIKTARKTLPGVIQDDDLQRYHATVVGVVITSQTGLFFHIGDGAAVAVQQDQWQSPTISLPDNGNTADQTYFYTQRHWYRHLRFTEIPVTTDCLALMSDGVTGFLLDEVNGKLQNDYFQPVDLYLQDVDQAKADQALQAKLENPGSEIDNRDDKTLLWARRV